MFCLLGCLYWLGIFIFCILCQYLFLGRKFCLTLIPAICLFKLVGNFEMLQSAPYASISAAISDCLPKKKAAIRECFYEILGSILSYNNIWEYF